MYVSTVMLQRKSHVLFQLSSVGSRVYRAVADKPLRFIPSLTGYLGVFIPSRATLHLYLTFCTCAFSLRVTATPENLWRSGNIQFIATIIDKALY